MYEYIVGSTEPFLNRKILNRKSQSDFKSACLCLFGEYKSIFRIFENSQLEFPSSLTQPRCVPRILAHFQSQIACAYSLSGILFCWVGCMAQL